MRCRTYPNPIYQPHQPRLPDRKIPSTKTAVSHHHKSAQEAPNSKRGQPKTHTPTKIFLEYSNNPEHEHVNVREASRKRVNQTAKILILNLSEENVKGNRQEISHDPVQGDVGGVATSWSIEWAFGKKARNESMTFRRRRKKTKSPQVRYCRDNFQCRPLSTCPVARVFKVIAWEHFTNARYLKHRNNWTLSY